MRHGLLYARERMRYEGMRCGVGGRLRALARYLRVDESHSGWPPRLEFFLRPVAVTLLRYPLFESRALSSLYAFLALPSPNWSALTMRSKDPVFAA